MGARGNPAGLYHRAAVPGVLGRQGGPGGVSTIRRHVRQDMIPRLPCRDPVMHDLEAVPVGAVRPGQSSRDIPQEDA